MDAAHFADEAEEACAQAERSMSALLEACEIVPEVNMILSEAEFMLKSAHHFSSRAHNAASSAKISNDARTFEARDAAKSAASEMASLLRPANLAVDALKAANEAAGYFDKAMKTDNALNGLLPTRGLDQKMINALSSAVTLVNEAREAARAAGEASDLARMEAADFYSKYKSRPFMAKGHVEADNLIKARRHRDQALEAANKLADLSVALLPAEIT